MGKLDDDTQNLIEEIFNLYDKDKSGDLTIKETVRLLTDIIEMGGEAN
jgi:Ca2+-binding EF-hand superfamily protein